VQPDDDKTRTHVPIVNGTMVSHYRIIEKIGAGGMGEVYLAEDTDLNRKVALKFLPLHLCQDADCRARFKREAHAAAQLDHPNIVAVHEVSEFQGRPFFSMQHVEGQTLKEVLSGKSLPLDRILEISIQVCEGLQAAHERGITHRDIKPSNILIDSHGRARIVDFGLASVLGLDHLTKTGSTLGTIGYMSPEQVRGDKVDHRTDLFSFGVVLYEMITGHAPFKTDSEAATLHAITDTKPEPLARFRREVPPELQTIIDKSLEKGIATRYQHADDIATDLKRLSSAAKRLQAPRRRLWNRYVVVTAAALVLIVASYWGVPKFLTKGGQKPESIRKMLAVLPFENLGAPEDEYFADGITDEITAKLASIRDLGVISRSSIIQYRKTTKSVHDIAKELGVDYILEGTILWDNRRDTSRVRIIPQLIRVSDDTHLWAETYQRPLTDIFALQADIAARIVEAMNITLLGPERAALQSIPTRNMDAYEAYLRGLSYREGPDFASRESSFLALRLFQRAVELDSTFALAYAQLAYVNAGMYHYGHDQTADRLAKAKTAADRAISLQPNLAWGHYALAYYYYWGHRDYERALGELAQAEVGLPNDPEILLTKAYIGRRQGTFKHAIEQMQKVFVINPRDSKLAYTIAETYTLMHEYASAEEFLDQAISLAPDKANAYLNKAENYCLWRADTTSARATLTLISQQDEDRTRLGWFWLYLHTREYSAALDQLESMSRVPEPTQFRFVAKPQLAATIYGLMHDGDRARACFDSARVILEHELDIRSDDHRVHSSLGIVYAGLGRKDDALREGKRGVDLFPVSKDAFIGPARMTDLAIIYLMVGEYDSALDQIEYLLSIPSWFSVSLLRLDPRYDPLRKLPRYQKLMEKYGT